MKTTRLCAFVLALITTAAGHAQVTHSDHASGSTLPAVQLGKSGDAPSLIVLACVDVVKRNGAFKPQVDQTVQRLDNAQVRVQGFMLPLEVGDRHQQFLLTSIAPSCAFCMPGGPETVVEVAAKLAMRFTAEPVTVAGKLVLLRDDSNGLYYRLLNAAPVVK